MGAAAVEQDGNVPIRRPRTPLASSLVSTLLANSVDIGLDVAFTRGLGQKPAAAVSVRLAEVSAVLAPSLGIGVQANRTSVIASDNAY
jgi:hypothetical protein